MPLGEDGTDLDALDDPARDELDADRERTIRRGSVLVLGAAGGVGEGIVAALLEEGSFATVVAATRDESKRIALLDRFPSIDPTRRLIVEIGGVDDLASAEALATSARSHGPLLAVVASLGGWWEGPRLTELGERDWDEQLTALLRPHFIAARTFVPLLTERRSRYLVIGGGAARTPVPGSMLVSIAGAAQAMLVRGLVAESTDKLSPLIRELVVDGPVKTNARHHGPERDGEITAREVGAIVADLLHDGTAGTWPNVVCDGPLVTIRAKGDAGAPPA